MGSLSYGWKLYNMNLHCQKLVHSAIFSCMLASASAWAQQTDHSSIPDRPLFSLQTDNLKKELQRDGILQNSSASRYRVAVPLASFGEKGPKLMFTYAPKIVGGEQRRVFLLYLHIDLD
jgi:hypothetical protein